MKRLVVLIALSLIICFTVPACSKPHPKETANAYLEAWKQGNYQDMYELLSVESQSSINQQDFVNRYTNIFSAIKLDKLEITAQEIVIEEDEAYLPFKAQFYTNTVGTFEYEYTLPLVLEDKQWKISWSPSLIFPIMGEGDKVRIKQHTAKRGTITDREGNPLAVDGPAYTVGAKPSAIPDIDSFVKALASLIEMDESAIHSILNQKWVKDNPDFFVPIKNLPFNISEEYKSELLKVKGVMLSSKSYTTRQYPMEQAFAHVTGYVQKINQDELKEKASKGYEADDLIGRQGIEAALEESLRGQKGYTLYIEDQEGKQKYIIASVEAQDGNDVMLTIDPHLQKTAYEALKDHRGSVIALNPSTGEILAMVSQPSFDPNVFPVGVSPSLWKAISQDPNHPLVNRCIQSLYPPGSVFKPFTAAMALELGVITPETVVPEAQKEEWIPSSNWTAPPIRRVPHPAGDVNLRNAIVWSDNIFFAWTGLKIGYRNFESLATRYGIGQALPFILPVKNSQVKNDATQWSDALLANTSYGQGEMLITPLQLAAMYTAFYNGGKMMLPQIIKEIRTSSGQIVESLQPKPWLESAIPQQHVETLLPMLVDTVEDPTGTAHRVKIPGLTIAGKTGTAQVGDKTQEIAWFIGFTLNSEKPLLVCVALEVPAGQGDVKLDIARRMFTEYYR
ncbi:MAG: penicillin-binding transpeptidase domain-containing protein [Caldicoprobacter sp.]|uniref:penicillin-binding transpeptidase domain-containing protein n=1 Tax=Caldicoprobacter sp. TaxID=2004500 RepID=UPI0039C389CE